MAVAQTIRKYLDQNAAQSLLDELPMNFVRLRCDELRSLHKTFTSALSSLDHAMNMHRPINALPSEFLLLVFHHTFDALRVSGIDAFMWPVAHIRLARGLASLAQVCRHWRKLCLDDPQLWNNIYDVRDDSVTHPFSVALERSQMVPLNICIDSPRPSTVMRSTLRAHGGRVRELHILPIGVSRPQSSHCHVLDTRRGAQVVDYAALEECLQLSLGILEHATLCFPGVQQPTQTRRPIFSDSWARLQSLSLHNSPWLPTTSFPNLSRLCISYVSYSHGTNAPATIASPMSWGLGDLLDFLAACPALADLVLAGVCCAPVPQGTISLSNLRHIVLGEMNDTIAMSLLRCISRPVHTAVRIFGLRSDETHQPYLSPLVETDNPSTMLRVQMPSHPSCLLISSASAESGIRIELPLRIPRHHHHASITSSYIAHLAPWEAITELHLVESIYPRSTLRSVLAVLPNVVKLVYTGGPYADELSSVIDVLEDASSPPNDRFVLLPGLEILEIYMFHLWSDGCEGLTRFAEGRRKAGHSMRAVIVHVREACFLGAQEMLAGAKVFLDSVEVRPWDGAPAKPTWPAVCTAAEHEYWPEW